MPAVVTGVRSSRSRRASSDRRGRAAVQSSSDRLRELLSQLSGERPGDPTSARWARRSEDMKRRTEDGSGRSASFAWVGGAVDAGLAVVSRRDLRDAESFFADLVGRPPPLPRSGAPVRRQSPWPATLPVEDVAEYLVDQGRASRGFVPRGPEYPGRIHAAQDIAGPRGTGVHAAL